MVIEPRFHDRIATIAAADWDALRPDDNPFVAHAFLHALERDGCLRDAWGWRPYHLGLYERGKLIAAAPLYLKGNSHGEFVFDWSWADAWQRAGGDYYPKLLCGVPYSPVGGPRMLAGRGVHAALLQRALAQAMREEAERLGLSSVHVNFLIDTELDAFDDDWLARGDIQYHWHNRGWRDFEDFLAALSHKKRKNIRHERMQVARAGLDISMHAATALGLDDWRQLHALYLRTFEDKGNHAALTASFFSHLREFGDGVQVALARRDGEIIAMALFLQSRDTLYGRYWGAREELPGLHFELCYYRGIEHAIRHGLRIFEPGAQGQHKIARGFLPTRTHSRHYLVHEGFRHAVARALTEEAALVDDRFEALMAHSPYAQRP